MHISQRRAASSGSNVGSAVAIQSVESGRSNVVPMVNSPGRGGAERVVKPCDDGGGVKCVICVSGPTRLPYSTRRVSLHLEGRDVTTFRGQDEGSKKASLGCLAIIVICKVIVIIFISKPKRM